MLVVSADNLAGGIASAAFIAYLSSLTNISYSATQYALFSSLMLLLPKFIAGYSGEFVDAYGYSATSSSAPRRWACRCCCWWGWLPGADSKDGAIMAPFWRHRDGQSVDQGRS